MDAFFPAAELGSRPVAATCATLGMIFCFARAPSGAGARLAIAFGPGAATVRALGPVFRGMVGEALGPREADRRMAVCVALFAFLAGANLAALAPWGMAPMAHPFLTCGMSLSFWTGAVLRGFSLHGMSFFALWAPAGLPAALAPVIVPVELASFVFRGVVIGGRVAANVTAGHLLVGLAGAFCAAAAPGVRPVFWVFFFALFALEAGVSLVQAYVVVVLLSATWEETGG
uniref:ATP synthase subunit a n=1 Tax=Leucosolenia complicata TaxID=433461 RepID=A0A140CUS2_9METZ|nr:ATP synthase F0 subunit 6 [Leucosolenia complicata]